MKKFVPFFILSLALMSFTWVVLGGYTISGTAAGVSNGTIVRLERQDPAKGSVVIDSTKVQNGKFTLKGSIAEPEIHFVQMGTNREKVAFILEDGNITLTMYKDSIGKSRIGGTRNNEDLQRFNVSAMKIQDKIAVFQSANNDKMQKAQAAKDNATINSLMEEYRKLQNELIALATAFPEQNPDSFISVLFIDNMFNNPEVDIYRIKNTYAKLNPQIRASKQGKIVKTKIDNYRDVGIGAMAPDFSAPAPDGKPVSLKQSLGKITIIDFWASWCGPCRRENPNVVALYNEFHPKGLNIVGVSLDRDAGKWKEAIQKDGLPWTHMSNLMFWSDPIAELYGVKSIPATFILDSEGKIIGKDLRGEALHAKIKSLLP